MFRKLAKNFIKDNLWTRNADKNVTTFIFFYFYFITEDENVIIIYYAVENERMPTRRNARLEFISLLRK